MKEHPAVHQHLNPRVQMKPWVYKGKYNVWAVSKAKNNVGEKEDIREFGTIDDYHTIRAGSPLATKDMLEIFFRPLKDYKVYLTKADEEDGDFESDLSELNLGFSRYNHWIIKDKNGKKVSNKTKEDLKEEILKHQDKTIEIAWAEKYETYWDKIVKNLENYAKSLPLNFESQVASFPDLEQIVMFMISLKWRTKPYPNEFKNLLKEKWKAEFDPTKLVFNKEERTYSYLKTLAEEYAHSELLVLFENFLNKKGALYGEARLVLEHFNVTLYQIPENKENPNETPEFLTCDNPVREYKNFGNKICYYYPITPKLAFEFSERLDDVDIPMPKYIVRQLNKERVYEFNELMKENSYKHYIMKGNHPSRYFG